MTVIDQLRQATRTAHEELEQSLDILSRLSCPAEHVSLMRAFYAVYEPAERALSITLDSIPALNFVTRRKVPALLRDLRALGVTQAGIAAIPVATLPALSGRSYALGFAYVLEGASLGGRVITKQLRAAGLPLAGTSFFAVYGEDTGTRWREFRAVLEVECTDAAAAVTGARAGFAFVRNGLGTLLQLSELASVGE